MRQTIPLKPLAMGGVMGLMMLWMVHQMITGQSDLGAAALAVFVGAHLLIALAIAIFGYWATRFAPRVRARLARLHRPTLRHVATMAMGGVLTAALAHLILHGGV